MEQELPDHQPTSAEITELMGPMSLRPLLDQDSNTPMLIVNGADDVRSGWPSKCVATVSDPDERRRLAADVRR